ncbi:CRAL/TRIO domain protein [Aspergillus heteromorphus CBS 117.55]|uniref:CRAL/TRIO domain protein n=1 Tax=Aspergillus heteromorphus CBS 117.55 TaxID=1448321 RepID=A0A317V2M5_9EURO|nr:CRAL/TRIO domain protein [Aspergillus heteromorphus CBS 117.55]PWY67889.1 CRAL/TRIO domain protein [Aspergillus heteromorphus CBS 117.55]
MTTNVPSGFIGNLSQDQEAKLQQLWSLVLTLLDIQSLQPQNGDPVQSSLARADTAVSANSGTAFTDDLSQVLRDSGMTPAEIKAIRDNLGHSSIDDLRSGFLYTSKHDSPDVLLLRFLRARKWDVNKAFGMMLRAIVWRVHEQHVDDQVIANPELNAVATSQNTANPPAAKAAKDFLEQLRMGKCYMHGTDRQGRPVLVVRVRLHQPSKQSEEVLNRFILHTIETARLLLAPPSETVTIIFDMTGFGLSNMEYAPVKFIIKCFEENYPESLGNMLIHNAPWVFSGIWKVIKGWMDPVIVSKVQFTNKVSDLEKFIAPDQIMKELKGKEDWTYSFAEPVEGENDRMADTETRDRIYNDRLRIGEDLLLRTSAWITASEQKDRDSIAATKNLRAQTIESLRQNYWQLDPYVRGRTYLDRVGVIQEGGTIDFYPSPNFRSNSATAKTLEVGHFERTQLKVVDL